MEMEKSNNLDLEESMLNHVEAWRNSGLIKRDYAHKVGVSIHKLNYWIQKSSKAESSKTKVSKPCKVEFIELLPSPDASKTAPDILQKSTDGDPRVELSFPGGLCLRIF